MYKQKIIIFEEDSNLDFWKKLFQTMAFVTPTFFYSDSELALQSTEENKIDIIILGVFLSLSNSFSFLEKLQLLDNDKHIDVIMVAGVNNPNLKKQAIELGVRDFISVPLQKMELVVRVNSVVSSRINNQKYLEAEAKLQKAEYVNCMTANMVHKFNNIFQLVQGYNSLNKSFVLKDAVQFEELQTRVLVNTEKTTKALTKAKVLTEQLLCYTQRNEKNLNSHGDEIDLQKFINVNEPLFQKLFSDKKLFKLGMNLPYNSPIFLPTISKLDLVNIILNLLTNANESSSEQILLSIELETVTNQKCTCCTKKFEGDFVKITATDYGIGIEENKLSSIFEPFFTTKGIIRLGLGLSVISGIVHNSQGYITVNSEPNIETTFSVYLPFSDDKYIIG